MMKNDINGDVNPMYELARLLGLVLLHHHLSASSTKNEKERLVGRVLLYCYFTYVFTYIPTGAQLANLLVAAVICH
jgi:hypothetical protein